MAGYGAALGRGIVLGAGAALVYAAVRESPSRSRPVNPSGAVRSPLVDWDLVRRVAGATAGRHPALHPTARSEQVRWYEEVLADIQEPLTRYTGWQLQLSGDRVHVLDRLRWVAANTATFQNLLAPVEDVYAAKRWPSRSGSSLALEQAARGAVSAEIGLLVGYLSRRVLAQYDPRLLGGAAPSAGALYFVEPNLRALEDRLNVPGPALRRWVALHEATHAYEFEAHPWVKEYLESTLREYLRLALQDLAPDGGTRAMVQLASRVTSSLRQGHGLLSALMTAPQRALVSRLQALMSLAEGYSNHVMNVVGRDLLPEFDVIHERVEQRHQRRSHAEQIFLRLTGLSLKMEQYRLGERFVDAVVAQRGIAFANRAWESAEQLPSEAEIRHPERWIDRLEQAAV